MCIFIACIITVDSRERQRTYRTQEDMSSTEGHRAMRMIRIHSNRCCTYLFMCNINSILLTSSYRMPYKDAILFEWPIGERLNTHSDLCVFWWVGALSTRHACRAIMAVDLCTRNRFSESMGSRFSGHRQKALPGMNEFTLLWIFA